ncbi:MAG: hypothetical protein QM496_22300 [Verrucomicrobiota bacterium]
MADTLTKQFGEPLTQANVLHYADRVRSASWIELWPDENGDPLKREVKGQIWNAPIQAALDKCGEVYLPKKSEPYYLDHPIVLKSGQRLRAAPDAEIRLKPGSNTCMVRNENIRGFREGPVPKDLVPDSDILVEGGIWTTLYFGSGMVNGNQRGHSGSKNWVVGSHGVILLQNIRGVVVRNLTIKQSRSYGIHIGTGSDFLVENITFEHHGRDGVHVAGASSFVIIRNISGTLHDDPVALNAWEWSNGAMVWGPIHHVLVEKIQGAAMSAGSTDSIRLLPGVKRFPDGSTLDCDVHDVVIRDIVDIRDFKLYNQPNLEAKVGADYSVGVGNLRNIHFGNLTFNRPGSIQIHADSKVISIRGVQLNFPKSADFRLLVIGPQSATYKGGSENPEHWREIFSPDVDCKVSDLHISGVRWGQSEVSVPASQLVRVVEQKINADYPKTTPRGGHGKGVWIRNP